MLQRSSAAPPPPPRARWRRWSRTSWLFAASLFALFFAFVIFNWMSLFLVPLALISPALITYAVYVRWLRRAGGDDPTTLDDAYVRMTCGGFWPAAVLASLVEGLLTVLIAMVTVGPQIADKLRPGPDGELPEELPPLDHDAGFVAFLALTAFVTAACVEEAAKAMVVRCSCLPAESALCVQGRDFRPRRHAHATVALLLAAGAGFATSEQLGYVFSTLAKGGLQAASAGDAALVAVLRGLVSVPLHVLCALLTGLRLTLRDAQRAKREALAARASVAAVLAATAPTTTTGAPLPARSPPPVVVLTDGAGQHMVVPSAAVLAVTDAGAGGGSPAAGGGYADVGAIEDPQTGVRVWSWPRVLWPAVVLHGTFDFCMLLIATELAPANEAAAVATSILVGLVLTASAYVVLVRQFTSTWPALAEGTVPPRGITTCDGAGGAWLRPCCWQRGSGSGGVYEPVGGTGTGGVIGGGGDLETAPMAMPVPLPPAAYEQYYYTPPPQPQQQAPLPPPHVLTATATAARPSLPPPVYGGAGAQAYGAPLQPQPPVLPQPGYTHALLPVPSGSPQPPPQAS